MKEVVVDGPFMDIHSHVLPGIDDGSSSVEQTTNMLKQAFDEGIRVIVATPHFGIRNPDFEIGYALELLDQVQDIADKETPGLRLTFGNELFYSEGIIDSLKRKEAATMGGTSYALVEFSTHDSYERICKCVREFTWNGYRPILAHVERYLCLENDIESVAYLVEQGAVMQVNCRSLMTNERNNKPGGRRGIFSRRTHGFALEDKAGWARRLLEEGLVHFIASDCHDDGMRRPVYRSTIEEIAQYCDETVIKTLTKENILKLLRNERIC